MQCIWIRMCCWSRTKTYTDANAVEWVIHIAQYAPGIHCCMAVPVSLSQMLLCTIPAFHFLSAISKARDFRTSQIYITDIRSGIVFALIKTRMKICNAFPHRWNHTIRFSLTVCWLKTSWMDGLQWILVINIQIIFGVLIIKKICVDYNLLSMPGMKFSYGCFCMCSSVGDAQDSLLTKSNAIQIAFDFSSRAFSYHGLKYEIRFLISKL